MQKPYQHNHCCVCEKLFDLGEPRGTHDGHMYCMPCYKMASDVGEQLAKASKVGVVPNWGKITVNDAPIKLNTSFNEPEHYHKHNIDTIQFLQEGFPPDVFEGFAIGHIIKYIQRYHYKGGREDLIKAVDYANRLLDWHDKSRS